MRSQKEINDLLASIRSGLSRSKKKNLCTPNELGMWNIVISILEWVNGADNIEIDNIKNGL